MHNRDIKESAESEAYYVQRSKYNFFKNVLVLVNVLKMHCGTNAEHKHWFMNYSKTFKDYSLAVL